MSLAIFSFFLYVSSSWSHEITHESQLYSFLKQTLLALVVIEEKLRTGYPRLKTERQIIRTKPYYFSKCPLIIWGRVTKVMIF